MDPGRTLLLNRTVSGFANRVRICGLTTGAGTLVLLLSGSSSYDYTEIQGGTFIANEYSKLFGQTAAQKLENDFATVQQIVTVAQGNRLFIHVASATFAIRSPSVRWSRVSIG